MRSTDWLASPLPVHPQHNHTLHLLYFPYWKRQFNDSSTVLNAYHHIKRYRALLFPNRKLLDDVCHAHQVTVYPETFYLIVNRTSLVYLSRSFFYHKYFQDHTSITSTILQFCDDKANLQSYLKCWIFYNIDH